MQVVKTGSCPLKDESLAILFLSPLHYQFIKDLVSNILFCFSKADFHIPSFTIKKFSLSMLGALWNISSH